MKATGIVRKVDELGRIVLPVELRRTLNIEEKDSLEIFVTEDTICLKKYSRVSDLIKKDASNLVNAFGKRQGIIVMVTDTERVIISQDNNYENQPLSKDFIGIVNAGKKSTESVSLMAFTPSPVSLVIPIHVKGTPVGAITVITQNNAFLNTIDMTVLEFAAKALSGDNNE